MTMLVSGMSGFVAAVMVLSSPAPATDAPAADATETAPAPDQPELDRARDLYQQGEARFAVADYARAIELWSEAFGSVPDSTDAARIKALLIYNIATAREKSYEVTGDVSHLRQAKILMEGYAASIPALFGDTPEAEQERTKITERLNAIAAQIDAADRKKDRNRSRVKTDERPDDGPDDSRANKAMIGAGAAALAIGVGGLAMMGAGIAMGNKANDLSGIDADDIDGRREQFDRGRTGNTLAIAGGVVGGVFAITGAVLVGLGASRNAKSRQTAMSPWLGGKLVGLSVRARF